MKNEYSHMCRDGHVQIGHNDSTEDRCPVCRERDRADRAEERYQEEHAIVDRVWEALGIDTYEGAGGKAIDELVAELKEKSQLPESASARLERHGDRP